MTTTVCMMIFAMGELRLKLVASMGMARLVMVILKRSRIAVATNCCHPLLRARNAQYFCKKNPHRKPARIPEQFAIAMV